MGDLKGLIMTPMNRTVIIIIFLSVFIGLGAAINQWSLYTIDAGEVDYTRFDRLTFQRSDSTGRLDADESWKNATLVAGAADLSTHSTAATTAHQYMMVEADGTGCKLKNATAAASAKNYLGGASATGGSFDMYAPDGTQFTVSVTGLAGAGKVAIDGCEWMAADALFTESFSISILRLLISVAYLLLPVAVMLALSSFGSQVAGQYGAAIMAAIMLLVSLLVVTNLAGTLIPFAGDALTSIDEDRFQVLSFGVGGLSGIISSFWAIALIVSFVRAAWGVVNIVRGDSGGGLFGGGQMASDRM